MKLAKLFFRFWKTGLIFIGAILITLSVTLSVASQSIDSDCPSLNIDDVVSTTVDNTTVDNNGNHYFLTNPGTWSCARSQARNLGADLVSIHDIEQAQFLADTYRDSGDYLWIGLIYADGQWSWTDNTNFDFYYWAPGVPVPNNIVGVLNTFQKGFFYNDRADKIYRGIGKF